MGNQIFQVSMLFAVRELHGYEFYLPHDGESVWDCLDIEVPADGPPCTNDYSEADGSGIFDQRVFEQPDGTDYHGYFQSYRYHEHCKEQLLKYLRFHFRHRALSEAQLFAYRRAYRRPIVSVHVRRGDYVQPGSEDAWGNLAKDGYYERAVEAIGDDVLYLVFSDDLEWCRQHLHLGCMEFADFDQCTSLCLMTSCDVNVVANSSFSWWGAYLNPGSDVYAPCPWFRNVSPPHDRQDDVVPPEWRTIPTFG